MAGVTRRDFLGKAAAAATGIAMAGTTQAQPGGRPRNRKLILPPALRLGDKIAITAPAGVSNGQAHIERAMERVRGIGFTPVPSKNILDRYGYLAGSDMARADDLNAALRDPDIRGILYLRGGYGAMRILPLLDYQALRQDPKVTMGFSDITALHLAFLAQSGVVTYHGPCAESSWNPFAQSSLPVVTESTAYGLVPSTPVGDEFVTLVPGKAKGRLVGGNLSLVVSLHGTPYFPDAKGAILFLEDIGEEPYRVDRMLTELLLSRTLQNCAGIVFGNFRRRPRPGEEPPPADARDTFTMSEVLLNRAKQAGVPAFRGLRFGHLADNHILPLGVRAEINADACQVTILDPAVS